MVIYMKRKILLILFFISLILLVGSLFNLQGLYEHSNPLFKLILIIFSASLFIIIRRMGKKPEFMLATTLRQEEKKEDNNKKKVFFDDVAGLDEVKEDLQEITDFLKFPEKYNKMGAKIPKGVMF